MRYTNFTIENYKGINKLELDIDILPDHKIYALVGLNESGKTTILEAINDFEYEVPETLRHLLIPKSSAGGFTGIITIKATLRFNEEDKVRIKEFIAEKQKFAEIILDENLIIQRDYSFDNSKPGQSKSVYYRFIKVKKTKKSKHTPLDDPPAISRRIPDDDNVEIPESDERVVDKFSPDSTSLSVGASFC
jgi:AAA15 family ATPase/GTPase